MVAINMRHLYVMQLVGHVNRKLRHNEDIWTIEWEWFAPEHLKLGMICAGSLGMGMICAGSLEMGMVCAGSLELRTGCAAPVGYSCCELPASNLSGSRAAHKLPPEPMY